MGETTAIEWCDHTFNPWVGCTKISLACDNCYAESWAKRTGHPELWDGQRRRTTSSYWRQPHVWNAKAAAAGVRRRVFCASLADVFDNQVWDRYRNDLWHLINQTPHLDWLLLTKRPQNIGRLLPSAEIGVPEWGKGWPNVWLGTTVENQTEADRRIPHLLRVPARIRFLSCEPILGRVCLASIQDFTLDGSDGPGMRNALTGEFWLPGAGSISSKTFRDGPRIDWVICGGESGAKARPSHPDWHRSLRDQCAAAGVPFLFKQWGEWLPGVVQFAPGEEAGPCSWHAYHQDGTGPDNWGGRADHWWNDGFETQPPFRPGVISTRVGKKRAGRLLDGVEHNGFPAI